MGSRVRGGGGGGGGSPRGGPAVPKVPEVNPWFWAVKIATTAMGEAVSDFLVRQFNPYLAVFAGFVVFAIAIGWQFRVPGYRTWPYWSAVAMVAVFGTMVADAMHVGLGIPYKVSVTLFAVALAVVLVAWHRAEHTLSIHTITTPRREFFYWATVCCTFALGTATGDLTATTLHLGYFTSGVAFTLAIMVPLAAWRLGVNPVLTFWVAYILTRPIGASFADYFGMPADVGGLGIGHGPVSGVTLVLVAASIWYLSVTGKDRPSPSGAPAAGPVPVAAAAPAARFAPGRPQDRGELGGPPQGWGPQGPAWQPQPSQPGPAWQPQGPPQGWGPRGPAGPRRRPGQQGPGWQPQGGRPGPEHRQQPGWEPRSGRYPDPPPRPPRRS